MPWLIGMISLLLFYTAAPVSGQGFLQRLEERVRQRIQEGAAFQPPSPENTTVIPDRAMDDNDRPTLGVEVDEVPKRGRTNDVVVAAVQPNSAAAAAGLKPGDKITSFGGVPIASVADLSGVMQRSQQGDRLLMIVQRDGQRVDLAVRLQANGRQESAQRELPAPSERGRPALGSGEAEMVPPDPVGEPGAAPAEAGRLGLTVEDPPSTRGRTLTRGAQVVEVTPGAPAAIAGLKVGDTIVALDGALIPDAESLILQMRRTRPGQRIDLQYVRDQKLGRVRVTLGGAEGLPAKRGDDPESEESASLRETASRKADNSQTPPRETSGSGLDAIGSMLGGLFGGGTPAREGNAAGKNEAPLPKSTESLPSASTEPLPSPNDDPPPSLEPSEPGNASPAELQQTIRRLEATNRRLESRLQQLEERMEAILKSTEVKK